MDFGDGLLGAVLGVLVLAWLAASAFLVLDRVVHDRRIRAIERRRVGAAGLRRPWIPQRVLERAAADGASAPLVAASLSAGLVRDDAQELVDRVRSRDERGWRRIVALRILVRGRWPEAHTLLRDAIEDDDRSVVAAAVDALGAVGDEESAALLVTALRAGRIARSRVAAQLEQAGGCDASILLPLFDDAEPSVRFWAATLLGRFVADPGVVRALVIATDDPDPSVRAGAVESLTYGDSRDAADAARRLVGDPVWFVRAHAARGLSAFGRDGVLAEVGPLLADRSWWVRAAAKETLIAGKDAGARVAEEYLEHPDPFARDGAVEVLQHLGWLDAQEQGQPV